MADGSVFEFDTLVVDQCGQIQAHDRKSAQRCTEALGQDVELELVAVPGGSFMMGAPKVEEGWQPSQSPQHSVTIAPFWMGKDPVTQGQWSAVVALPQVNHALPLNPSCFTGVKRPVEQVSWQDAIEFCDRLSVRTGRTYRLPSEAEWEYACRATTLTPFSFGETITTELANYSGVDWIYEGRVCSKGSYGNGPHGSDRRETTEVGSFAIANAFGLHDMHGLVREWCYDCWHDNYDGAPADGSAWVDGGYCHQRVLRGGSWNGGPKVCRSAYRSKLNPDTHLYDIGFRVVWQPTVSENG